MQVSGQGAAGLFILSESPSKTDDERGAQFVGTTGQLLRETLAHSNIDLDNDCWKLNAVNCRPPAGRKPTPAEIIACRPAVLTAIRKTKPKVLLMMGAAAVESVVGYLDIEHASLSLNRGIAVPLHALGCWGVATWGLSDIERMSYDKSLAVVWRQDLKQAIRHLQNSDMPTPLDVGSVKVFDDPYQALDLLHKMSLNEPSCLAFDYETTGLKPDAKGHRIITLAVSPCPGKAWAFPWIDELREPWVRLLKNKRILKAAHHKSMEQRWSAKILGAVATPCIDTALLAHIADNRRGFTGLDKQAWVRFGLPYWGKELEYFIIPTSRSKKEFGGNALNQISKAPIRKLLKYNGIDALVTQELVAWHKKRGMFNAETCCM